MVYNRDETDTNRLKFITELLYEMGETPAVSSLNSDVDRIKIVENAPRYVSNKGEIRPEVEHGFFDSLETSREEMARFLYETIRNRKELDSHQKNMREKNDKYSSRTEHLAGFLISTGYDMLLFTEDLYPERVYFLLKKADHPLLEEYKNPGRLSIINSDMKVIRTAYRIAYKLKREGKV